MANKPKVFFRRMFAAGALALVAGGLVQIWWSGAHGPQLQKLKAESLPMLAPNPPIVGNLLSEEPTPMALESYRIDLEVVEISTFDRLRPTELSMLFHEWMRGDESDLYFEETKVLGRSISRCRGRYEWEDGARMEYELTDMGSTPNPALIQALGFNLYQENGDSDSGFTRAYEIDKDILLNEEFDVLQGEGSLQLLVHNRFLLEVQVEGYHSDVLNDLMQNYLPIDALIEL